MVFNLIKNMYEKCLIFFLTLSIFGIILTKSLQLPNMSGISRELTGNLSVDQFFSLWIIFNDDDVQISGTLLLLLLTIIYRSIE